MLTAAAPAAIAAAVVAGVGVYAGIGIPLTELSENVLILVVVAECSLCIAERRTKFVDVLGLNEVTGKLILFNDGCLQIAAATLHLSTERGKRKLILIAVLQNFLLR